MSCRLRNDTEGLSVISMYWVLLLMMLLSSYVGPSFSLNNPNLKHRICAENDEMRGLLQHSARFSRMPNSDFAFLEWQAFSVIG
jgi:hypothetical protein